MKNLPEMNKIINNCNATIKIVVIYVASMKVILLVGVIKFLK